MSDIGNIRRKINSLRSEVHGFKRAFSNETRQSRSWWVGLAGDTFRQQCDEVEEVSSEIETSIKDIYSELSILDDCIRRAKREQKEKLRMDNLEQRV